MRFDIKRGNEEFSVYFAQIGPIGHPYWDPLAAKKITVVFE